MIIAKGMTAVEHDKYGPTLEGLKRWSQETGKELREADARDIRQPKSNLNNNSAAYSVEISSDLVKLLSSTKKSKEQI